MDYDRSVDDRPRPFSRARPSFDSEEDERPLKRQKKSRTPSTSESSVNIELRTPQDSARRPSKRLGYRRDVAALLTPPSSGTPSSSRTSHSYEDPVFDTQLAEIETLQVPSSQEVIVIDDDDDAFVEPSVSPFDVLDTPEIDDLLGQSPLNHGPQASVEAGMSSFPRSAFDGWQPPLPVASERSALKDLVAVSNDSGDGCVYLQLDDFSVYRPETSATDAEINNANELTCLSRLSLDRFSEFVFDGMLSCGERQTYVQGVRFKIMALQYDGPLVVWIQSDRARREDIWFTLRRPSREYRRFYQPFLWLATFTRHFMDFLTKGHDERVSISLHDFKSKFYGWLCREGRYKSLASASLRDFRTTLVANNGFLWKEWVSTDGESRPSKRHALWSEIDPQFLDAIPKQRIVETQTIVTPFVYQCFPTWFQYALKPSPISDNEALQRCAARKERFSLTPFRNEIQGERPIKDFNPVFDLDVTDVVAGDVVCTRPSKVKTSWENSKSQTWYAYVSDVRTTKTGRKLLDVIWLYEACDTTIGTAPYIFPNELFLSDNCNCGSAAWDLESVFAKVQVTFFASDPYREEGFFVRQKFRTVFDHDQYDFVTLRSEDFTCICRQDELSEYEQCKRDYSIGDTVLLSQGDTLVPAWVNSFNDDNQDITIQRLQFERTKDSAPNELVLPERDFKSVKPSKLIRKCQLRVFGDKEDLPVPYDRGGAGDFYFMRGKLGDIPAETRQGWHPSCESHDKIAALAMFCGGGNYDRGIEDSNIADVQYAVDMDTAALHSHRANALDPDGVQYFLGSVNDYLAQALAGKNRPTVATVDDVGLLLAGSPCQGYSILNSRKWTDKASRQASMVASVVAHVDFYVPAYVLLENVPNMTSGAGPNKENVFSHVIGSLCAMGYQVQQFLIDAWTVGSPQGRSRLFVVVTAPGFLPLRKPAQTHADPPASRTRKGALGKLSNGFRFARRENGQLTPFPHVSPAQATQDLPPLGEVSVQLCPKFPDHRIPIEASKDLRSCMALVPKQPQGMTLALADLQGKVSGRPLEMLRDAQRGAANPAAIKSYSRIARDGLFPTIITHIQVRCRQSGRYVHWDEDRVISVQEVRRAVGCPDEEVFVGTTATQIKIMGNCVDRKVALALGLSLRESWLGTLDRGLIPPRSGSDEREE